MRPHLSNALVWDQKHTKETPTPFGPRLFVRSRIQKKLRKPFENDVFVSVEHTTNT